MRSQQASRKPETSTLCGRSVLGIQDEPMGELGPRSDSQLAVDTGERRLDRVLRQKQRSRDFAIRLAARGERSDTFFARAQLAAGRSATSDPSELGTCLIRPEWRA